MLHKGSRKADILREEDCRLQNECVQLARKVHELATRVQVQRLRIAAQEASLERKQGKLRAAREEITGLRRRSTLEAIRYAARMQCLLDEEAKLEVSEKGGLYLSFQLMTGSGTLVTSRERYHPVAAGPSHCTLTYLWCFIMYASLLCTLHITSQSSGFLLRESCITSPICMTLQSGCGLRNLHPQDSCDPKSIPEEDRRGLVVGAFMEDAMSILH